MCVHRQHRTGNCRDCHPRNKDTPHPQVVKATQVDDALPDRCDGEDP